MRGALRAALAVIAIQILALPVLSACASKPPPPPKYVITYVLTRGDYGPQDTQYQVAYYGWYSRNSHGDEHEGHAALPWQKEVTVSGQPIELTLRLVYTAMTPPAQNFLMGCQILVNGNPVAENHLPAMDNAAGQASNPIGVDCYASSDRLSKLLNAAG